MASCAALYKQWWSEPTFFGSYRRASRRRGKAMPARHRQAQQSPSPLSCAHARPMHFHLNRPVHGHVFGHFYPYSPVHGYVCSRFLNPLTVRKCAHAPHRRTLAHMLRRMLAHSHARPLCSLAFSWLIRSRIKAKMYIATFACTFPLAPATSCKTRIHPITITHTRAHAQTYACTHVRMHTRPPAHTHTRTCALA